MKIGKTVQNHSFDICQLLINKSYHIKFVMIKSEQQLKIIIKTLNLFTRTAKLNKTIAMSKAQET